METNLNVPKKTFAFFTSPKHRSFMYITSDHQLYACGSNQCGNLLTGDTINQKLPVLINTKNMNLDVKKIVDIQLGGNYTIFLLSNHNVMVLGCNKHGQLGLSKKAITAKKPVLLKNLENEKIVKICVGYTHSIFITDKFEAFSCGNPEYGKLGRAGSTNQFIPGRVRLSKSIGIISATCGTRMTLFLTRKHDVYKAGILHNWTRDEKSKKSRSILEKIVFPKFKKNSQKILKIAAGCYHYVALTSNKTVFGAGKNREDHPFYHTNMNYPSPIQMDFYDGKNVVDIRTSRYGTLCLTGDGMCWGQGYSGEGELGKKYEQSSSKKWVTRRSLKKPILLSDDVAQIESVYKATFLIKRNGDVYVAGSCRMGEMGLDMYNIQPKKGGKYEGFFRNEFIKNIKRIEHEKERKSELKREEDIKKEHKKVEMVDKTLLKVEKVVLKEEINEIEPIIIVSNTPKIVKTEPIQDKKEKKKEEEKFEIDEKVLKLLEKCKLSKFKDKFLGISFSDLQDFERDDFSGIFPSTLMLNKFLRLKKKEFEKEKFIKFAFVCGINEYDNFPKLKTCVNDACKVSSLLEELGFDVTMCTDCDGEELTDEFDSFCENIREIVNEKKNESLTPIIIFSFSGHGVYSEDSEVLIPTDFKQSLFEVKINAKKFQNLNSKSQEKLIERKIENARRKIASNCLTERKIKYHLSNIKKDSIFCMFIDACRNVVRLKQRFSLEDEGSSMKRCVGSKYIISYSTDKSEYAMDMSKYGENSPYNRNLVKRLREKGDLVKLLFAVHDDVVKETNGNQKPICESTATLDWNF